MQEIDLIFNLINATSLPCFPKTTLTISLIRQWFFFQRWSQYNFSKQPEENCIKSIEKHYNDILFTYSMRCSTLIMINFLSFNRRLYRLTKEQTSENYAYVHSATPPLPSRQNNSQALVSAHNKYVTPTAVDSSVYHTS